MPDRMRRFCMGNALVVPMVTRMGRVLDKIIGQKVLIKIAIHIENSMSVAI